MQRHFCSLSKIRNICKNYSNLSFMFKFISLVWIKESFVFIAEFKHWISQHCIVFTWLSHQRVNASALVSLCCAAVWTAIRADKRSVWCDSNELSGFVPLLAHKHYIALLSNSSYRFIEENYIEIIIVSNYRPALIIIISMENAFSIWILYYQQLSFCIWGHGPFLIFQSNIAKKAWSFCLCSDSC